VTELRRPSGLPNGEDEFTLSQLVVDRHRQRVQAGRRIDLEQREVNPRLGADYVGLHGAALAAGAQRRGFLGVGQYDVDALRPLTT
jgi:hypothetical protein